MKFQISPRTWKILAIAVVAGIVVGILLNVRLFNFFLVDDFLEAKAIDHMSNFAGRGGFSPHVKIVVIRTEDHHGPAPWGDGDKKHRQYFGQLIRAMTTAQAKVLAFDVVFDGKSDQFDNEVGSAIAEAKKAGLSVIVGADKYVNSKLDPEIPAEFNQPNWGLINVGAYRGNQNDNKPIRAMKLAEVEGGNVLAVVPSLALRIVMDSQALVPELQSDLNQLFLYSDEARKQLSRTIPLDRGKYMILDQASRSDLDGATVDAQRIFDDFNDAQALSQKYKGAIVLVGYEKGESRPIRAGETRLGVELHATTVSNILERVFIYKLALIYSYVIVLIMALLAGLMYTPAGKRLAHKVETPIPFTTRHVSLPVGVLIVAAVYLLVAVLLFMFRRIYLDVPYHLAALLLSSGGLWLFRKKLDPEKVVSLN